MFQVIALTTPFDSLIPGQLSFFYHQENQTRSINFHSLNIKVFILCMRQKHIKQAGKLVDNIYFFSSFALYLFIPTREIIMQYAKVIVILCVLWSFIHCLFCSSIRFYYFFQSSKNKISNIFFCTCFLRSLDIFKSSDVTNSPSNCSEFRTVRAATACE